MNWYALAAACLAVVVFELLRRRNELRRARQSDPDLAVLSQLRAAGSDLSKPHVPEFFLCFNSEEIAREVGRRLEEQGFAVRVEAAPERDGTWLCLATKSIMLYPETLARLRDDFTRLAQEFEGRYDGWGCPVPDEH